MPILDARDNVVRNTKDHFCTPKEVGLVYSLNEQVSCSDRGCNKVPGLRGSNNGISQHVLESGSAC